MFRNFKVILVVLVVLVLAGGAYAFAAGNTVPPSAAGYTANVVSGYTVSNIVYDLDKDNPINVDNISFSIAPTTSGDPVAKTVYLQTALSGPWTTCVVSTDTTTTAVCTLPASPDPTTVTSISAMNIVASSSTDPTTH